MLKNEAALDRAAVKVYGAARESVAIMDRSAWGHVEMAGEDRIDFLHRMSTNEVRDLTPGTVRRTVLTSDIARVVAVVTVHAFADHLLLLTDPGGAERVINHLRQYIFFRDKVELADATERNGMLSLWGPRAASLLDDVTSAGAVDIEPDTFVEAEVDGAVVIVSHTDELGSDGVNVIVEPDAVESLLDRLVDAGAQPMDSSVYEVLRVEAGQPRYGRELGEEFNPLEAGLRPIINFEKGCYIGQEVVARLDTYDKVKQQLVGVQLERLPISDTRLDVTSDDNTIGTLTSWVQSPAYGAIALGYVLNKHLERNMTVEVADAEGRIAGQVVDLPFE